MSKVISLLFYIWTLGVYLVFKQPDYFTEQ